MSWKESRLYSREGEGLKEGQEDKGGSYPKAKWG